MGFRSETPTTALVILLQAEVWGGSWGICLCGKQKLIITVATSDWNNYETRHEVAVRQKGEMFDTFCIFTETLTNKTDEKFLYTN